MKTGAPENIDEYIDGFPASTWFNLNAGYIIKENAEADNARRNLRVTAKKR